jgi:hypothetical protein
MFIIKGGAPEPEPEEDTFLKDLLLTRADIYDYVIKDMITEEQYNRLIQEVPNSNN